MPLPAQPRHGLPHAIKHGSGKAAFRQPAQWLGPSPAALRSRNIGTLHRLARQRNEEVKMPTKTESRTSSSNSNKSNNSSSSNRGSSSNRSRGNRDRGESNSIFNWDRSQTGVIVGAAVAGAAVGIAANMGRKLLMQMASTGGAEWDEALANEHRATLAVFDKIEMTDDSQTMMRATLLAKLKYALTKHALQEENVIYPALRQANSIHDADALESEHGYVKTYLYELETMAKDSPEWLARVRDFRAMIEEHMRMEEDETFPTLRRIMSEEQNSRLTAMMNKEGYKFA
jgi:hemerythrin superfamily protein